MCNSGIWHSQAKPVKNKSTQAELSFRTIYQTQIKVCRIAHHTKIHQIKTVILFVFTVLVIVYSWDF